MSVGKLAAWRGAVSCAVLGLGVFASSSARAGDGIAARCLNLSDPALALPPGASALPNPILFVTQMPIAADLASRFTTFGNHLGQTSAAGRGGDLWLLYPPSAAQGIPAGCLRNLTREAGLGTAAEVQEGDAPIAVREPRVHWDGQRALVSIVRGAPSSVNAPRYYWQIHEVTGLGLSDALAIAPLPHQPPEYNHVSPLYGADEGIVYFTSDIPRSGPAARHLYPQQDEYERNETVSGLWRLDTTSGELALMSQSPSGTFTPMLDSLGRLITSRWDHLQRDIFAEAASRVASEAPAATAVPFREEFPEPLPGAPELPAFDHPLYGETLGYRFKHFLLWQIQADGSGEEILNHLGRHELVHFFEQNFDHPGNGLTARTSPRPREETIENMLQAEEDPTFAQRYVFVDAQHFQKQSSGRLLRLDAAPGVSPDDLRLVPLTEPHGNDPASPDYDGDRYRDPLPLSNGLLLASHANPCGGTPCADDTRDLDASAEGYAPNFRFALRLLRDGDGDGVLARAEAVTPIIARRLRVWGVQQNQRVLFDGAMSQLDAVEVRSRVRPPLTGAAALDAPEQSVFAQEAVDAPQLQAWMIERDLALMVVRDATTRDLHDRQQPFNLRVADSTHGSVTPAGQVVDVRALQLFQADLVSGYVFRPGRRPLAVPMHDVPRAANPAARVPPAAVGAERSMQAVSSHDGSVAAFVPARRALTWQLTDRAGFGVVRERYWLTFQPGEIRVCTSCHGPNALDQLGREPPRNEPAALRDLLRHWKQLQQVLFADGFDGVVE
jgi:hypothetical protein